MTGRQMIIYILENGLEDEEIFQDDRLVGYLTAEEVAIQEGVTTNTVYAWIVLGAVDACFIGGKYYIPGNYVSPMKRN